MYVAVLKRLAAAQLTSRASLIVSAQFSSGSNRKSNESADLHGDNLRTARQDASYFTQLLYAGNPEINTEIEEHSEINAAKEVYFEAPIAGKENNRRLHQIQEDLKVSVTEFGAENKIDAKDPQYHSHHRPRNPDSELPIMYSNFKNSEVKSNTTKTLFERKQSTHNLYKSAKKNAYSAKFQTSVHGIQDSESWDLHENESVTSQLFRNQDLGENSINANEMNETEIVERVESLELADYAGAGEEEGDGSVVDLAKLDPLAPCSENLDLIAPVMPLSLNLAAYANRSRTVQQLLNLGVDMSNWDKMKDVADFILKLDFDKDMTGHIRFLHDVGIAADNLGIFITKNPRVFQEDIDILGVRVDYLASKKFTAENIARILTAQPRILQLNVAKLDRRLGNIQKLFKLSGNELRHVTVRNPRIVIHDFEQIKDVLFSIREEMGFNEDEIKTLILTKPKLWLIRQQDLVHRFNFLHNKMEIPHKMIVHFPSALLTRDFIIRQRHLFLKTIGRNQYDPLKEGYVSLKALVSGTDAVFCRDVAKMPVTEFNKFLKTL